MTLLQVLRKMKWALELKWLNTGPAPLYNNTVQVCRCTVQCTVLCSVQYSSFLGFNYSSWEPECRKKYEQEKYVS